MASTAKVSIIILNWNGFADTVECLNSIEDVTYKNYDIVLVDNASDNEEGKRIKGMFPQVKLIQNTINRGFAGGNNDGMNWALANGCDYVVNLNNDCIVTSEWLSNLIAGVEAAKADFATSVILHYYDNKYICSDGDVIFLGVAGIASNVDREYKASSRVTPIFSACGAASLYSKKSLQEVKIKGNQFFDELFFAYFEDIDLGIRLNYKLFKGVCVQNAIVYHKGQRASGKYSEFHIFTLEKNRILVELLNYPWYLIPVGEIVNLLKMAMMTFRLLFIKELKSKRSDVFRNFSIFGISALIFKAKLWALVNLPIILADRRERKRIGFINRNIIKFSTLRVFKWFS